MLERAGEGWKYELDLTVDRAEKVGVLERVGECYRVLDSVNLSENIILKGSYLNLRSSGNTWPTETFLYSK